MFDMILLGIETIARFIMITFAGMSILTLCALIPILCERKVKK